MENPWPTLPTASPYVLPIDRNSVDWAAKKINVESIPEPFIGNPRSAKVVLLGLNPGDSPDDAKAHSDPAFRNAMLSNLRHERQEYPFYALNPNFKRTGCAQWWLAHLKGLLAAGVDVASIAEGLLVIEWFPYHSKKGGKLPVRPLCPSQHYSFQLAKAMLDEGKLVVGMRSKKQWHAVDAGLKKIPFLRNPQSPYVSRRNAGERLFACILKALRE